MCVLLLALFLSPLSCLISLVVLSLSLSITLSLPLSHLSQSLSFSPQHPTLLPTYSLTIERVLLPHISTLQPLNTTMYHSYRTYSLTIERVLLPRILLWQMQPRRSPSPPRPRRTKVASLVLSEMIQFRVPPNPFEDGTVPQLKEIAEDTESVWHNRAASMLSIAHIAAMEIGRRLLQFSCHSETDFSSHLSRGEPKS